MTLRIICVLAMLTYCCASAAQQSASGDGDRDSDENFSGTSDVVTDDTQAQPGEYSEAKESVLVQQLLARMTLAEKLGQLAQYSGDWDETGPTASPGTEAQIRDGAIGSFLGVYGADATRRLQRIAVEQSRLGIPLLFAYDVIHGLRTLSPMPLAEAASWDIEQIENSARIAAIEASAHGLHWTFAPMVDIARDPRWGRITEGAGEDPYLGSVIAAARVRGFQGTDLAALDTLLASAKHLAAYGHAEGGRDYNVADLSERTLQETYLPPFKAAVDAGVHTIMAAFNEINGVPAHANAWLINDLLRDQWGFAGVLVSDYTGVQELIAHGVAADRAHAGELALRAGVDIDMISGIYANELPDVVRKGDVPVELVDEAVARVLRAKYQLGLFDDPYRYSDADRQSANTLTDKHRAAVRQLGADSAVLLKNANALLPLDSAIGTLAVIGPLADDSRAVLGGWSMAGRPDDSVSILDGIQAAVATDTRVLYAAGSGVQDMSEAGFAQAVSLAGKADAVVLVLGESPDMSSEANNRVSLALPGVQQQLADAIVATGKPVVAVLVNGRPLAITELDEQADAILESWYLGTEMGNSVADILFGKVNPSGKLPVSFPRSVGQIPVYYNYRRTGRPHSESNHYTTGYIDSPFTPLYPFGYGLSYSDFEYSDIQLSSTTIDAHSQLIVSALITNRSDLAGTEIVQLYIHDPLATVTRPVRELKGFKRITLPAGESRRVEFKLEASELSFYNARMQQITEAGEFRVFIASSSADEGLETHFTLSEDWLPVRDSREEQ